MKKLLYFSIASTILFSCNSNEDEEAMSNLDPIIGTWQLTSETENGKEISTECQRKTTIAFLENGTTSEVYYYENGNNACESDTDSAKWENVGNSTYRITYGGDEGETNKVSFSNNNTVFTFSFTEEHNGTTYIYTAIYKKI